MLSGPILSKGDQNFQKYWSGDQNFQDRNSSVSYSRSPRKARPAVVPRDRSHTTKYQLFYATNFRGLPCSHHPDSSQNKHIVSPQQSIYIVYQHSFRISYCQMISLLHNVSHVISTKPLIIIIINIYIANCRNNLSLTTARWP